MITRLGNKTLTTYENMVMMQWLILVQQKLVKLVQKSENGLLIT